MRQILRIELITIVILAFSTMSGNAQNSRICSDQWTATDGLGRRLPGEAETGAPKKDKFVAIFYRTCHQGNDDTIYHVKNITEIVRKYPEVTKDYHHPAWGTKQAGFFFWEQPLFGYYKTTDTWVLRKHAEIFADAGIDAVFFDCTNGSITWKGKPCFMGYPDKLTDLAEDSAIAEFFIFRPGQPDYVNGPKRNDQWGRFESYPQYGYVKGENGKFEQVTVGVAQNAGPSTNGHCSAFILPGSFRRSFSKRNGFDPRPDGYLYRWNFQELWDRAFDVDPERVFITGWNEFDFIVNRVSPKGNKAIVERIIAGRWEWEPVAQTRFAVDYNKLELEIRRNILNLSGQDIDIEFKWNDNIQENGNIMDFYENGDTVPGDGLISFIRVKAQNNRC